MRTNAVRIYRHGGPEVLQHETITVAPPQPGEVLVRQTAIGLNFADVYQRRGEAGPHDQAPFPIVLGSQGAGVVEAVGPGASNIKEGDRVAYVYPGTYQAIKAIPASRVVPIPTDLSAESAAAALLRGLTAEYLLRRLYVVKPGATVLIHAAAGGMGLILCQWARTLGARVIGTVGSDAKMEVARAHGCHDVINYSTENFVERVLELTAGEGVSVVYDAVGRDVFLPSLECMRPMGMVISYGTASGPVQGFDLQLLHRKSLIVSRPTLRTYIADPADLQRAASAFFDAVRRGEVDVRVNQRYRLREVRRAHEELEGRMTSGLSVLIP